MSDTTVRVILVMLFFLALGQETWDNLHSRPVEAEVVELEYETTTQGNRETVYVVRYTDAESGLSRETRFKPYPPATWLYEPAHGNPRVGEKLRLRKTLESGLISDFRYNPWYCLYDKSLGFGLLAFLGMVMPIGESDRGFW
jgi:hypothetical protein